MAIFQVVRGVLLSTIWVLALSGQSSAQTIPGGACKMASERTTEVGCWVIADQPMGQLPKSETYWHLDTFPTRATAEAAKGPHGIVVEALSKVWLLSIEDKDWHAPGGEHVTTIGPLPIKAGERYAARYLEAIFEPGMTAPEHTHPGPEAWYTLAGETCLESSDGKVQIGRAGGPPVIVPGGPAMHLTATGTAQRRALVLILHESDKPAGMANHEWHAKGLCKS